MVKEFSKDKLKKLDSNKVLLISTRGSLRTNFRSKDIKVIGKIK